METTSTTPIVVKARKQNTVLRFQSWVQEVLEKVTFGIRFLTGSFYVLTFLIAFFWRIAYTITGKQAVQIWKTNVHLGPLVPGAPMYALYWWLILFIMIIINIYAISSLPKGGVKKNAEKNFVISLFLYNFSYFLIIGLLLTK